MSAESAQAAIEESIRERKTAELFEKDRAIRVAMLAICDGYDPETREYWGVDSDGDSWRVRLVGPRQ